MSLFLIFFSIFIILCVLATRLKILYNDAFWLLISWILIFGVFFSTDVYWKDMPDVYTVFYVLICLFGFFVLHKLGEKYSRVRISPSRNVSDKKIRNLSVVGVVGVLIYTVDFIRINGIILTKASVSNDISVIGVIGNLFVPLSLITGLYFLINKYRLHKKISKYGLILVLLYIIPCILHAGRESLLYIMIVVAVIVAIEFNFNKVKGPERIRKKIDIRTLSIKIVIVAAIGYLVYFIYNISVRRFTDNEISVFLSRHSVSRELLIEADKWGAGKFLYFHIIEYFGHQLPFIHFCLNKYNGPYMFGMYELNMISRRLPKTLGLDYTLVYSKIASVPGGDVFFGSWQTVLGSFIFDFGKVMPVFLCAILGWWAGKNQKILKLSEFKIEYCILTAIICLSMFTTIQVGPFYNYLIYGLYIWWWLIWRKPHYFK